MHIDTSPMFYYTSQGVFWFFNGQNRYCQLFGYFFNDKSIIYSENEIFYRIKDLIQVDMVSVASFMNQEVQKTFQEINILSNHQRFCSQRQKKQIPKLDFQIDEIYDIQRGNTSILTEISFPTLEIAKMSAFKNGSVKVRFSDRTIVSFIYPPPCKITILTSMGTSFVINFMVECNEAFFNSTKGLCSRVQEEFQYYVEQSINFAEEQFIKKEILQQRVQHSEKVRGMVSHELMKSNAFLITNGLSQNSYFNDSQFSDPQIIQQVQEIESNGLEEQIQRLLEANQKMILNLQS